MRTVILSDIIELTGGGTPKTSKPEFWNGDIPWLSVVDFGGDGRWVDKAEKTITNLGLENSSTKLLKSGDIIISARGTVGELAQLKRPMAFNQSCYGIRARTGVDQDFLYYLLKKSVNDLRRQSHGGVFNTITRSTFDVVSISIPSIVTQKKIANILSSLDEKIELNRRMNETLEQLGQALFRHYFVDNPEAVGWKSGTLGDIVVNFDSKRKPLSSRQRAKMQGDYRYFGATSVMDHVNDYLFDGTYLLLAEDGSVMRSDGTPYLQYVWGRFWVNNHAHIIQAKYPFTVEYIYLLLAKTNVQSLVSGAVQLKINQKAMNSLVISIPPDDLVIKFCNLVNSLFAQYRENEEQIELLVNLRDSLLPKLISGGIEV